jgi:hypothetical protein
VLSEDEAIDGDKLLGFFSYAIYTVDELTSSIELEGILRAGAIAMDRMATLVHEGHVSDDDFRTASDLYLNLHATVSVRSRELEVVTQELIGAS